MPVDETTEQRFKVVTDGPQPVTVEDGGRPKGHSTPLGLTKSAATADAVERNQRAVELGINTRYAVVPLS